MQEILSRLPATLFKVEIFPERVILEDPVDTWPLCDILIAFHSNGARARLARVGAAAVTRVFSLGYPLDKAIEYAALRKPFVVNDLKRQHILKDRRLVYDTLAKAGVPRPASDARLSTFGGERRIQVPTPRHEALSRDREAAGTAPAQTLEEYDDYIVVNGVKIEKPFVEKPVDSDDHNIYIYYPMSAGGGCKRLFRKIGNQSSAYHEDADTVRREGSFLYEEFVDTQGTDVKVYSVGPYYGHAEARKSPALDGIVMRSADGKELRYPVILSWIEKDIAFKIYHAFKQTVCGFDILRTHDGKNLVCDVNGWSFVKKSRKYYDDCAALLVEHMQHRRSDALAFRPPADAPKFTDDSKIKRDRAERVERRRTVATEAELNGAKDPAAWDASNRADSPASLSYPPTSQYAEAKARPARARTASKPIKLGTLPAQRELRCVIAVVRHGDRTPKYVSRLPLFVPARGGNRRVSGASSR